SSRITPVDRGASATSTFAQPISPTRLRERRGDGNEIDHGLPNCFQYRSVNGLTSGPTAPSFSSAGRISPHHRSYAARSSATTRGCSAITFFVSPGSALMSYSSALLTKRYRLVRTAHFSYFDSAAFPRGQRPTWTKRVHSGQSALASCKSGTRLRPSSRMP